MKKTFTIAYRTGDKKNTVWKKSNPFEVFQDAQREKRQIEMTGQKALIFDTVLLNSIGLPTGWDAYITDCEHE